MPDFAPIKKYPPHKIADLDYSCSAFLMYIGIDIDVTDQVRLHNVIFQMTLEAILKKYLRTFII